MYKHRKGFTLIELLVVISIISLISSVVIASLGVVRKKARDSARLQNAEQIAIALEQYVATNNTYAIPGTGLISNPGSGFVSKGGGGGYSTSVLSALKQAGLYSSDSLSDPIFNDNNYYLGLCTSTSAYNIYVKLEQDKLVQPTSSLVGFCGGVEAASLGFNYQVSITSNWLDLAPPPNKPMVSSTDP